jgi:hypothetical protein
MASPYRKPNKVTMFDESIHVQKISRDLVIYSALAGQIVRVAWLVCYKYLLLMSKTLVI